VIRSLTRTQSAYEHTEPKTILGFLLGFLGILAAAIVAIVVALVYSEHLVTAVFVMVAGFVVAGGILFWVGWVHSRNPTALMLGHVTARDYLAVQQWTAGDSSTGEETRTLTVPVSEALAGAVVEVEAGEIESSSETSVTQDVGGE
jgi:hypothetical protein